MSSAKAVREKASYFALEVIKKNENLYWVRRITLPDITLNQIYLAAMPCLGWNTVANRYCGGLAGTFIFDLGD